MRYEIILKKVFGGAKRNKKALNFQGYKSFDFEHEEKHFAALRSQLRTLYLSFSLDAIKILLIGLPTILAIFEAMSGRANCLPSSMLA